MRVIAVARSRNDNLTPEERVHRINRTIDDIKKPPSLKVRLKRFMTDPIIYPKIKED